MADVLWERASGSEDGTHSDGFSDATPNSSPHLEARKYFKRAAFLQSCHQYPTGQPNAISHVAIPMQLDMVQCQVN